MYSGVLIDLGNTICYNQDFNFNRGLRFVYDNIINPKITLEEFLAFTSHFKSISFDIRDVFEISFRNYLVYLISYFNLEFNMSLDQLEEGFSEKLETLVLIDGVVDFLNYLRLKRKKIVILSNSTFSSNTLKKSLAKLGILDYFDCVYSSGDYIFRKPHQQFFDLGIKYFNNDKNSFYYIGNDYYYDIIGATNLKLRTIWFNEKKEENYNNLNILCFDNYINLINILEEEEKHV